MTMKYCVTVTKTGCLFVEADNKEQAIDIANHQTTDSVNWSDDWEVTDCSYDDDITPEKTYIDKKAFE